MELSHFSHKAVFVLSDVMYLLSHFVFELHLLPLLMNLVGEHLTSRMVLICDENIRMSGGKLLKLSIVDNKAMLLNFILDEGSITSQISNRGWFSMLVFFKFPKLLLASFALWNIIHMSLLLIFTRVISVLLTSISFHSLFVSGHENSSGTLGRSLLRTCFDTLLSNFVWVECLRLILTLQLESFGLLNIAAALLLRLPIFSIILVRAIGYLNCGIIIEEFSELVAFSTMILLLGIHVYQLFANTHQLELDGLLF